VAVWVRTLLKWLVCAVLLGVVLYYLWNNRAEVRAGLQRFLRGLREFWQRLFGGLSETTDRDAVDSESPTALQPPTFADFANPFTTGTASRYSPDELVRYSFEALEAWARDQGCPRGPDQTPHEFAHQIGSHVDVLSQDVRRLADLYCRVAYAPDTLPRKSVSPLSDLWDKLGPVPVGDSRG
jgi:hypothetical protein